MSRPPLRKVLVTGGGGFIGSYVIEELLAAGIQPMLFDHSLPGVINHSEVRTDVELFQADIRDDVAVTEAAAHVDGIIHLAAVLGTQETIQNPRPSAHTNILGSLNVFEAAVQYDLPVVYAGVGNHWMREHGAGTYTISKTAVEDFVRMYNQFRGAHISVVRPVNAYGPRQSVAAPYGTSKVRKIIPSFVCRALDGQPIEVYGDGTQVSDCVYVGDVAKVFVKTLIDTASAGKGIPTLEVGPTESMTVNEVAQVVASTVSELTGKPPVPITHLPMRPGEVPNSVTKADAYSVVKVGLSPEDYVAIEDGIRDTVRWYMER